MSNIIGLLILGLVAGALAKLIYPGQQGGGIFATILLGILGSYLGGWIASLFPVLKNVVFAPYVLAIIGAMILIFLWGLVFGRTA